MKSQQLLSAITVVLAWLQSKFNASSTARKLSVMVLHVQLLFSLGTTFLNILKLYQQPTALNRKAVNRIKSKANVCAAGCMFLRFWWEVFCCQVKVRRDISISKKRWLHIYLKSAVQFVKLSAPKTYVKTSWNTKHNVTGRSVWEIHYCRPSRRTQHCAQTKACSHVTQIRMFGIFIKPTTRWHPRKISRCSSSKRTRVGNFLGADTSKFHWSYWSIPPCILFQNCCLSMTLRILFKCLQIVGRRARTPLLIVKYRRKLITGPFWIIINIKVLRYILFNHVVLLAHLI